MKILSKIQNPNITDADYIDAFSDKGSALNSYPARRLKAMKIDPKFWVWIEFSKLFSDAPNANIIGYDVVPMIQPRLLQQMPGYTRPSSSFVSNPLDLTVALIALESGMNQLLVGPTGCGKTYGAEQIMLRLGIPVFTVPCNKDTDAFSLFGQTGLKNGDTFFKKGMATLAIENYACVILDEVTAIDPSRGLDMNPLLENRDIIIDGSDSIDDVVITNHGMTHVIGTSNTGGKRSGSRQYKNAAVQDMAWRDRWETHNVSYRDIELERAFIENEFALLNPKVKTDEQIKAGYKMVTDMLVDIIERSRKEFENGGITVPVTSRGIKSFIRYYIKTVNLHFAFHMSIMSRAEESDMEALRVIFESVYADDLLELSNDLLALIQGK